MVLGGASSGKSEYAEHLAGRMGRRILYLATAFEDNKAGRAATREWKTKIRRHRQRRPASWRTELLNGRLQDQMAEAPAPDGILLDSLTLWVSARFQKQRSEDLQTALMSLLDGLRRRSPVIVVSDEVGLGLVPLTASGRRFLDTLGRMNAQVARKASTVFFVVSGQPIRIKSSK